MNFFRCPFSYSRSEAISGSFLFSRGVEGNRENRNEQKKDEREGLKSWCTVIMMMGVNKVRLKMMNSRCALSSVVPGGRGGRIQEVHSTACLQYSQLSTTSLRSRPCVSRSSTSHLSIRGEPTTSVLSESG